MGIRLPLHSSVIQSWFHWEFNNQTHLSLFAGHTGGLIKLVAVKPGMDHTAVR
ncbi:UNVERIFIED_CONTAM: hypothetical protein FKN15_007991 [Acipenser sinensis]